MSHAVVTGGAGFIGSALVRALLAADTGRIVVIDNLSSGKSANLAGLPDRVQLHTADIRDYNAIAPMVRGAGKVFHLAAIPSVPLSIEDPIPSHDANINGTFNVFRACAEAKVQRVVFAASSSAYGNTEELPKRESMPPNPLSPYAAQKVLGEMYGHVFANCYGLDVVSLRFFNVYGPRQDPSSQYSGVLSIFMKKLLERQPPVIYGDGGQTRDFTYVEDVAELVVKASGVHGVAGRVYNAGNGDRYTLNETWRLLCEIEGVDIKPLYGPPRAGDVRDSQADTSLAIRDLGHAPRFTFREGLTRTLEWYRTQRD